MPAITLHISGMTCDSCQRRIEKKLNSLAGVSAATVSFKHARAEIDFDEKITALENFIAAIEKLNYGASVNPPQNRVLRLIKFLIIICGLYLIAQRIGITAFGNAFPLAGESASYGMLFLIGALTSVHCLAMCGGINLSQCLSGNSIENNGSSLPLKSRLAVLLPSAMYNGGRIISYTLVGAAVGAVGSVLSLSGGWRGAVQMAAGVFMVLLGLKMLGFPLFNFSLGKKLTHLFHSRTTPSHSENSGEKSQKNSAPLVVGLLNGLMPCGPLQAMQLYALATAHPVKGALAMFFFSVGTMPLMFAFGAISSLLSKKWTGKIMTGGAILVAVLGLSMFATGWGLSGFSTPTFWSHSRNSNLPQIINGKQIINSVLESGAYPEIIVRNNMPVQWTIMAAAENINGCNYRFFINEYGIDYTFHAGENVIEFTPTKTGRFSYACWMGMIRNAIFVVDADVVNAQNLPAVVNPNAPTPAGVIIPTDKILTATITTDQQEIMVEMTDAGFSVALLVAQKGLPLKWIFRNQSADSGNSAVLLPEWSKKINTPVGDTLVEITPEQDGEFYTVDGIYFGRLKVVPDINDLDRAALITESENYETLLYPEAYFASPQ